MHPPTRVASLPAIEPTGQIRLPQVEGYRLHRIMGQGGMATVYEAVHERLGRRVAIKVLSREATASQDLVERFLEEARIVNEVRHPNIVDVTDFIDQEHPRQVAYVMELIRGPSLKVLLRRGPLGLVRTLNLTIQILDALESLHERGVIHRDLKPANLMVVAPLESDFHVTPCVKVLDFGIARRSESERTASGVLLGTPAYMAPEQVAGDVVDGATDIYAVGEILFECLTGRALFSGTVKDILRGKMTGKPPTLNLAEGDVFPETLEAWVSRCVSDDRSQRPRARELSEALTQERSVAEMGDSPVRRFRKPSSEGREEGREEGTFAVKSMAPAPPLRERPFPEARAEDTKHSGSGRQLRPVWKGRLGRKALAWATVALVVCVLLGLRLRPSPRPIYLRTQPAAERLGSRTPSLGDSESPSRSAVAAPDASQLAPRIEAPRKVAPNDSSESKAPPLANPASQRVANSAHSLLSGASGRGRPSDRETLAQPEGREVQTTASSGRVDSKKTKRTRKTRKRRGLRNRAPSPSPALEKNHLPQW